MRKSCEGSDVRRSKYIPQLRAAIAGGIVAAFVCGCSDNPYPPPNPPVNPQPHDFIEIFGTVKGPQTMQLVATYETTNPDCEIYINKMALGNLKEGRQVNILLPFTQTATTYQARMPVDYFQPDRCRFAPYSIGFVFDYKDAEPLLSSYGRINSIPDFVYFRPVVTSNIETLKYPLNWGSVTIWYDSLLRGTFAGPQGQHLFPLESRERRLQIDIVPMPRPMPANK